MAEQILTVRLGLAGSVVQPRRLSLAPPQQHGRAIGVAGAALSL
jgi:hypothetical protein